MDSGDVSAAFELLLTELEKALNVARENAALASRSGRYSEANAHIARAQHIERLVGEIKASYRQWQESTSRPRLPRTRRPSRSPRGRRTPEDAFRLPILRALVALGGSAPLHSVLARVFKEVRGSLTEVDFETLPSEPTTPRWQKTAQWARMSLVTDGLMRDDSPRGIWAISERGVAYLAEHGG
ncbi:MAG: hypothetical protein KatS3mg060_0124 [Dehalococcoidia bacterium]|nr:MAG: hypothetical protein KatS3mg060_0124 [Dehalococcoidia bacterium]